MDETMKTGIETMDAKETEEMAEVAARLDAKRVAQEAEPIVTQDAPATRNEAAQTEAPQDDAQGTEQARPAGEVAAEKGKRRRAARQPIQLKKTIATVNDMVEMETPEDRRAKDIDEIRRAIKQERILTAKVDGVEPYDDDNARIIGHRNSLKVVFEAKDFFHFSNMAGIEDASNTVRQQRYLRKARQMTEASVVFIPLMLSIDEETGMPFVVGSRAMAMDVQRERHFLSEQADVEKGVRTTATVLSTGPAYAIVEALGVETTIGAAHLSAYEYIEDVSARLHNGDGIEVMVTDLSVDRQTGKIALRVSRTELERQTTPVETISSVRRGGVYSATVLLATDKMYKVVLNGFKVIGYVSRTANISDELLHPGDAVNMMVHGHDYEKGYVWGGCHKK